MNTTYCIDFLGAVQPLRIKAQPIGRVTFKAPSGLSIKRAKVIDLDYFCDTYQLFVAYKFTGRDGKQYRMTQWVTAGEVLS